MNTEIFNPSPQFSIIDNNVEFVVINKAANVNFHDEEKQGSGLFSQVKQALKADELYPVHRLDKMTSGLIVMAKTKSVAQQFQQLFEQHKIEKYYVAISDQKPKKKQGLIKGDMAKSRRGAWKLLRSNENPAISQFFSFSIGQGKRLFIIKPHTGKTHQIRVALASIGAPILGDSIYHSMQGEQSSIDRGYLHALELGFTLNNQPFHYRCLPSEGKYFIDANVLATLKETPCCSELPWPTL